MEHRISLGHCIRFSVLLRHSREVQSNPPNFLDRKDARFKKVHGVCDWAFHELHEAGVGAQKSAEAISSGNESKLWDSGVLNTTTPEGRQKAMFYYVGRVCCLRGREKQRNWSRHSSLVYMTLKGMCTKSMDLRTGLVASTNSMWIIRMCSSFRILLQVNAALLHCWMSI